MPSTTIRTTARFNVAKITPGICSFNEQCENEMRNALRYHKSLKDFNVSVEFTRGAAYHVGESGVTQTDKVVCHLALDGAHSLQEVHNFLMAAKPRHVAFGAITIKTT